MHVVPKTCKWAWNELEVHSEILLRRILNVTALCSNWKSRKIEHEINGIVVFDVVILFTKFEWYAKLAWFEKWIFNICLEDLFFSRICFSRGSFQFRFLNISQKSIFKFHFHFQIPFICIEKCSKKSFSVSFCSIVLPIWYSTQEIKMFGFFYICQRPFCMYTAQYWEK